MKKWCVIIQGQSNNVPILKEKWNGVDLIWSTWSNSNNQYEDKDVVISVDMPEETGVNNLYLQKWSTLNGIMIAKQLGYTHVLKWRSDQYPTNPSEFIKLFNENKLTFLSAHENNGYPYLVDYFMGGPINDVELLWDIPNGSYLFPEEAITKQVLSTNLKTKIEYVHSYLSDKNDVYWLGREFTLSKMLKDDSHVYNPNLFKN
jgi:hypothetical protein